MRTSHESTQKAIRRAILLHLQGVYDPIPKRGPCTCIPRYSDSRVYCCREELLSVLLDLVGEGVIDTYTVRYIDDWGTDSDMALAVYSKGWKSQLELYFHHHETDTEPIPEINYKEAFLEIAAVVAKYIPLSNPKQAK